MTVTFSDEIQTKTYELTNEERSMKRKVIREIHDNRKINRTARNFLYKNIIAEDAYIAHRVKGFQKLRMIYYSLDKCRKVSVIISKKTTISYSIWYNKNKFEVIVDGRKLSKTLYMKTYIDTDHYFNFRAKQI